MAHAIKVIHPDGSEEEINRKLNLKQMQKIVGGHIEIVRSSIPHRSLVVNEEGLVINLPRNEKAYALLHADFDWSKQPGLKTSVCTARLF